MILTNVSQLNVTQIIAGMDQVLDLCYKAQFFLFVCASVCLYVCFNYCKTTNIILGKTDHQGQCHMGFEDFTMTPQSKLIFFNLHFLTDENHFLLKRKAASNLLTCKNFTLLRCKMTSQLPLDCRMCSLYFLKNYWS